jgi:hypothetical protein
MIFFSSNRDSLKKVIEIDSSDDEPIREKLFAQQTKRKSENSSPLAADKPKRLVDSDKLTPTITSATALITATTIAKMDNEVTTTKQVYLNDQTNGNFTKTLVNSNISMSSSETSNSIASEHQLNKNSSTNGGDDGFVADIAELKDWGIKRSDLNGNVFKDFDDSVDTLDLKVKQLVVDNFTSQVESNKITLSSNNGIMITMTGK